MLSNLGSLVTLANRRRKPILHYSLNKGPPSKEKIIKEDQFYVIDEERFYIFKSSMARTNAINYPLTAAQESSSESKQDAENEEAFWTPPPLLEGNRSNFQHVVQLTSIPPGKGNEKKSHAVISFEQLMQIAEALQKPVLFYTASRRKGLPKWHSNNKEEKDRFYVSDGEKYYVFKLDSSEEQTPDDQHLIREIVKGRNEQNPDDGGQPEKIDAREDPDPISTSASTPVATSPREKDSVGLQ